MMIALTTTEKIIKSRDRVRDNGEVFTPSWLVEDMLNLVSDEDWADPKKIFLEPACGNGNFLVAIYKKKIAFGSTPLQALQTIYGIDIMPDNIKECRQRLLRLALRSWHGLLLPNPKMMEAVRSNIRLGDALKFSMEDIFAPLNFASRELRGFRFEQREKELTPKKESTESA
tara:strand:+ start:47 stop:562 length:516 start_codon:yes stop_codon:yes gene_type:complete